MKGKVIIVATVLGCIILPAVALSIASFVIASQNKDVTCDVNTSDSDSGDYGELMALPTWLNVYGGVSLGMMILLGIAIALFFLEIAAGMIVFMVMLVLYQVFTLAWNIVGAVALFRDSKDCLDVAKSLWIMVLVVLIFQWIGFLQACCNRKRND